MSNVSYRSKNKAQGFFFRNILASRWRKLAIEVFVKEPNVTNPHSFLFGRKERENEGMEQFYGALSDLSRGVILIQRKNQSSEVFIFNKRNVEIRKQLSMETLLPLDALHFAVVRKRGQIKYKSVSGSLPKFGRSKVTPGKSTACRGKSTVRV